jgi:cellulose synthase operon protein C
MDLRTIVLAVAAGCAGSPRPPAVPAAPPAPAQAAPRPAPRPVDDRLERARQAVVAAPSDPVAHERLGALLIEDQRFAEAVAAYERVVQLDPHRAEARFALAQLAIQAGRAADAIGHLHHLLATSTDDVVVRRAGHEAVALEELTDTFDQLERVVLPLAVKPTHRRILIDMYSHWVPRLAQRERHATDEAARIAARRELDRIGAAALAPILEALRDGSDVQRHRFVVAILGALGSPAATRPLVQLARTASDRELRVAALVAAGRTAGPKPIGDLLPLMAHAEAAVREAATFALGRSGDRRAVGPLLAALGDSRPSVQTLACLALAQLDDRRVGPALTATLADVGRGDAIRAACAYAIGAKRLASGTAALLAALDERTPDLVHTQRLAAWSLGQLGDPGVRGRLIAAYFSRAGRDGGALVWAIARLTSPGSAPAPTRPLADYPMRAAGYDALAVIASLPGELPRLVVPPALLDHAAELEPALLAALSGDRDTVVGVLTDLDAAPSELALGALAPTTGDAKARAARARIAAAIEPRIVGQLASPDLKVRALAISVLAKLDVNAPATDAAITAALQDPHGAVREAAMRSVAIVALRRGAPPVDLVRALVRLARSAGWLDRRNAVLAIGKLGRGIELATLTTAASDVSSFVREAAATALGETGGAAAIDALLRLSRDEVPQVRAAAAKGLGPSNDPRAQQRRRELAGDPDLTVRAAATAVP